VLAAMAQQLQQLASAWVHVDVPVCYRSNARYRPRLHMCNVEGFFMQPEPRHIFVFDSGPPLMTIMPTSAGQGAVVACMCLRRPLAGMICMCRNSPVACRRWLQAVGAVCGQA
jgi:hypothetical protein